MDRDDLHPCRAYGTPCDGGVCDAVCAEQARHASAVAYREDREFDIEGDESGPAQATLSRDYYCLACCANGDAPTHCEPVNAQAVKQEILDHPLHHAPECYICGEMIGSLTH